MTDLEMTKLCAEAIEHNPINVSRGKVTVGDWEKTTVEYDPLHDDVQAMALVKKFPMETSRQIYMAGLTLGHGNTANRVVVECVAKMQASRNDTLGERMSNYAASQSETEGSNAAQRWYEAASPYATPGALRQALAAKDAQIDRLREYEAKVQEAEGRVCPEDVGFEEYIRHLLAKLALAAEDAAGRTEANSELLWAAKDVVKWLDSQEVSDTFQQAWALSVSHPHLASAVRKEFSVWASVVLKRFRAAVAASSSTR